MAKDAIYYEEARRLFVDQGLSIDTVLGMLEGRVARKTLYNWKIKGNWDELKKRKEDFNLNTKEVAREVLRKTAAAASADPSKKNMAAFKDALMIMKMLDEPLLKIISDQKPDPSETSEEKLQKKENLETLLSDLFGGKISINI